MSFGEPQSEWTVKYEWTRRDPTGQPIPTPKTWVLNNLDANDVIWQRFPEFGDEASTTDELDTHISGIQEANERRQETAVLSRFNDPEGNTHCEFSIDGDVLFRRVNPEREELWETIAQTLNAYPRSAENNTITIKSGHPPDEEPNQDARRSQNRDISDFGSSS